MITIEWPLDEPSGVEGIEQEKVLEMLQNKEPAPSSGKSTQKENGQSYHHSTDLIIFMFDIPQKPFFFLADNSR